MQQAAYAAQLELRRRIEPVFCIGASCAHAPDLVEDYASALSDGEWEDSDEVKTYRALADQIRTWQRENPDKVKAV